MIDEMRSEVKFTGKIKRLWGKTEIGECGYAEIEPDKYTLLALKNLYLKTIEECKPKKRYRDELETYEKLESSRYNVLVKGGEMVGYNQAISTYYDNLRKRVK